MDHILFIQSPVDEHLGCFHPLVFVNSAAVNKGCMEIILNSSIITEWNIIQLRKIRLQPLSAAQANFITLGLQARRKLQEFNWIQLLIKTQK